LTIRNSNDKNLEAKDYLPSLPPLPVANIDLVGSSFLLKIAHLVIASNSSRRVLIKAYVKYK
jgi:hypothetical protein